MNLTPKKLSKLRRGRHQSRRRFKKGKKCLKITFRKKKNVNLKNSIISSNSTIIQNNIQNEQIFLLGEGTKVSF